MQDALAVALRVPAQAAHGARALLAPAALSILTTTFSDQRERGKAFGVYGAIAGGGGGLAGLLLGGALTEYLSWRWCLYVNLFFAGLAVAGATVLLRWQRRTGARARLDVPGVLAVSGSMFCLVYGLSNAAAHNWRAPSTWGYLTAGVVLLAVFAAWQARAANPLLPLHVIGDRNRSGANLAVRGYTIAFWWTAGIFAAGAVVCGALLRRGPLASRGAGGRPGIPAGQPDAGPAIPA
ncbi:MAG TPA: MFS transporter [Streptosporangiaceae bacterium]|nr:MFS transporter [Streptosporangiaceae bacterium]